MATLRAFGMTGACIAGNAAPIESTQEAEQEGPEPWEQQRSHSVSERFCTLHNGLPVDPTPRGPRAFE